MKAFLSLLAATMLLLTLAVPALAASGNGTDVPPPRNSDMPAIGFKVRRFLINTTPSEENFIPYDKDILYFDLEASSGGYLWPYINTAFPNLEVSHEFYTFVMDDIKGGKIQPENGPFGKEWVYNRNNTGHGKVALNQLPNILPRGERLHEGDSDSYYQITVRKYLANTNASSCDPKNAKLIGDPITAKLYVCVTRLDQLDSNSWKSAALDTIYQNENTFIQQYLSIHYPHVVNGYNYKRDEWNTLTPDIRKTLKDIPISWALADGTAYSAEPGAVNAFTWTADPEALDEVQKGNWIISKDSLSKTLNFANPFAVTFKANGKEVETLYVHQGGILSDNQFPAVPEEQGYTGRWERTGGFPVTGNMTINAVYTPVATPTPTAAPTPTILPPSELPKTGDNSQMVLWLLALAAAVGGMAAWYIVKKRP